MNEQFVFEYNILLKKKKQTNVKTTFLNLI